jgi:tetratricopeptide (TPR) repeat protein
VRAFVTPLLRLISLLSLFLVIGAAVRASGEVIHLKNGRTIWADHVTKKGSHVEYEVGDDSYALSASSVDHIDSGGIPPERASSETKHDIPVFAPADSFKSPFELSDKIVHGNSVDENALAQIEKQGKPDQTAAAYYVAGKYEFEHGNFGSARGHFESAVHSDPENPAILSYYAALLVRTGDPKTAVSYAEKAVHLVPESPDALAVLGYAQFAADHNQDAIRSWKKSLALRPDNNVQQYLAKAEHEDKVEANFSERESSHFTIRYEGKQTSNSFRSELINTLEGDYDDLMRDFGISPRSIPVVLYTDQAFFDVTQAASWTGAVNDGKLRIPVQGMDSVSPELARVLKHELAHSFINQLSAGKCPQWLNEGTAQALEPKSLSSSGNRLADLFEKEREIPFNALEGSFMRFSGPEATLAYDESLAAVQYIIDTYGMSDVQHILKMLGEGSSTEVALRTTIHSDYQHLDYEVRQYLISRYGH